IRDVNVVSAERIRQIIRRAGDRGRIAAAYFVARGGRLLFGSDTPSAPTYANPPGRNGYLEMVELERAGIPPRRIFDAATRANAQFFGLASDYGTIEPGKKASLLLLRADPLTSVTRLRHPGSGDPSLGTGRSPGRSRRALEPDARRTGIRTPVRDRTPVLDAVLQ